MVVKWHGRKFNPINSCDVPILCRFFNSGSFVSVVSQKELLSEAVIDCLNQANTHFKGDSFNFGQLFVSQIYEQYAPLAPQYLFENLNQHQQKETAVIGGTVQDLLVPGCRHPQQGVSLLAGHIPDARIFPFETSKPSLPALTGDVDWKELFSLDQQMAADQTREKLLMLLLAEPYFYEIEHFLRLMSNLLPATPIVGGIVHPVQLKANTSPQGTLFINDKCVTGGAVGCLIKANVKMYGSTTVGGEPVGPTMRVTQASQNMLLELDGKPALDQLMVVLNELRGQNVGINIAVDEKSGGKGFVLRNLERVDHASRGVILATDEIAEGSNIQVHVRNDAKGGEYLKQQILDIADKLQPNLSEEEKNKCCMLMYSCVGVQHNESEILTHIPNSIAFQGGKMQGEIGPLCPGAGGGVLHTYTSTIAAIGHNI
eukprot:TRINITY_DN19313_c0_g1_i1.p1 TRINITY_DN19313_c0_g1~~TRINITY_DN19313_c0_g1_i1.p1  ORF type:complete len:429 (+),score=67.49 TRINITY_DN19313_c0_g1_i1:277-1563(+)